MKEGGDCLFLLKLKGKVKKSLSTAYDPLRV